MFRSKTVLILGAGASAEVGLPVGDALLSQICELIDIRYGSFNKIEKGDPKVSEALKILLKEGEEVERYNEHLEAALQVISSAVQALSIDNIVHNMEDSKVELVAKLGIVRAIQKAEEDSRFFKPQGDYPHNLDFGQFRNTWYSHLTKLLSENRRKSELSQVFENLVIVSFNYDRCIENYLPRSIAHSYGVPVQDVLEAFGNVPIHRPYGIAGKVEFNTNGGVQGFGNDRIQYLAKSAQQIRTFTEGVENPDSLKTLRLDIAEADRIVFLGSAFHSQNLEVLEAEIKPTTQILATTSGISEPDLHVVREQLVSTFRIRPDGSPKIVFADMYCNDFFQTHWRTLTA